MSFEDSLAIGIMGNIPGHISNAENIQEGVEPTGVFAFYVPDHNSELGIYSLTSGRTILHPRKGEKIQVEPEIVLDCSITYENGLFAKIIPHKLSVGNDFSIRTLKGTTKISQRKVWGKNSKGFKDYWWDLPSSFNHDDFGDEYKIMSFIRRNNILHEYSIETSWSAHKLFYDQLLEWTVQTLNTQKDQGIKEDILNDILKDHPKPQRIFIYAGAPDYTNWGHTHSLEIHDEIIITAYNNQHISLEKIKENIENNKLIDNDHIIYLHQEII